MKAKNTLRAVEPIALATRKRPDFRAAKSQRFGMAKTLFLAVAIAPVALTAIYLFVFCADRYVSEAQFIVRSISQKRIAGLDSILKTFGMDGAQDDSYAITAYLQSKDALRELEASVPVRDFFSRPEADMFSSLKNFWTDTTFESLYLYSRWRISVVRDVNTGVTTLRVTAFRPEDAMLIAQHLLEIGEGLANSLNFRAQQGSLRSAHTEVTEAEAEVEKVSAEISDFRNRELLVNPADNSMKVIELIGTLSAQLALNMAEIKETMALSPNNPAIDAIKARSEALQNQITTERGKLGGNDHALASEISTYEKLILRQKFAEKMFASALTSLEAARQDARRQQVYIETFVRPDKADEAMEPRRFRILLTVAFVSILAFALAWVVYAGTKEHANG